MSERRRAAPRTRAAAKGAERKRKRSTASPKSRATTSAGPTRLMRIRELNPQNTCGIGTTVLQLFRVDDLPSGSATTHLVFFDRHGWYCEHGRDCPAVAAVRKRANARH